MKPKLFIPQPIPQVAVDRLEDLVDLTIYPHTDRRMPYDEVLEAVRDQDILYAAPHPDSAVHVLIDDATRNSQLSLSPNGRWLAHRADRSC